MQTFLEELIKKIVSNPEAVKVSQVDDVEGIKFEVRVDTVDFGRVIGKGGKTINAIRNLFNLYKHNNHPDELKRVYVNLVE